jgi:hypothetical protein
VVATGDLNRDGSPDLVWQHLTSGYLYCWLLGSSRGSPVVLGEGFLQNEVANPLNVGDVNWRVAGAGDFNGDGKLDLALENFATGALQLYYLDGIRRTAAAATSPNPPAASIWSASR